MDVPLTPIVVDVVTFDRAPLGRRGYHEDQVDDFLDRVQATLAGEDNLTATQVREVEFDPAPFIRRGYHEDQVDEFLDLVVEELDRRAADAQGTPPGGGTSGPSGPDDESGDEDPHAGGSPIAGGAPASGAPAAWVPFPGHQPRPVPPPTPAEQTNPMLFTQPPSLPSPSTRPLKRAPDAATGRALADYAPKPAPTFPLPPAPRGEPGYAPSDVAALLKLLATSPDREQLLAFTLTRTDNGGFHAGTVDALRQAWLDALPTKRP